jgi:hypothetical protein
LQTQREHEAATDKEVEISLIQLERRSPSAGRSDTQTKGVPVNTLEGWASQAFLRQKAGQSSKKLAQK